MKKILLFVFLLESIVANISFVAAQETLSFTVDERDSTLIKRKSIVIIRKRAEKEKTKGIIFGQYTFQPSIMITEYHEDNVYSTETAKKNDLITIFTPKLNLKSNWSEHEVNLDAGLEVTRYADLSAENTENAWLKVNGKYDFTKEHHILAGMSYSRDHEDRGIEDALIAGDKPIKFEDKSVNFGYSVNKNNNFIKLIYNTKNLNFYDVDSSGSVIDNDDRDRDENALGFQYLYKYSSSSAFFINGIADQRKYAITPDNDGNDRNSKGQKLSTGLQIVGKNLVSNIFVQQLTRNYDSSKFNKIDESDIGFKVNWKFLTSYVLNVKSSSSIEETTINTSPGYLKQDYTLNLNIALADNNKLNFYVMHGKAEYYVIPRNDVYMNYSVGYDKKISSNLYMSVELHRAERNSNFANQDYISNQVLLRINAAI